LAPFYDLLSVATYDTPAFDKQGWPAQTQLAWPILGVRHFSDINRALLLETGASLNLAKGTAERLLENLRSRAEPEAEALCAEVEAENAQIAHARPALSATMAGESRCLRTILHAVIKEMTKQIA
jgi:serine/threonine-protein kinase HipA